MQVACMTLRQEIDPLGSPGIPDVDGAVVVALTHRLVGATTTALTHRLVGATSQSPWLSIQVTRMG